MLVVNMTMENAIWLFYEVFGYRMVHCYTVDSTIKQIHVVSLTYSFIAVL